MSTKDVLRAAVAAGDFETIRAVSAKKRRALGMLFSMTFTDSPLDVSRAVLAVGIAAEVKAAEDLEKVRDFMRRCIWSMNDESGGIGWHAPEAMGEVLFRVPRLIPEYGGLLFHYFEESPFERGAVAAVARISGLAPSLVREHAHQLLQVMDTGDPLICGFGILAMRGAGLALDEERCVARFDDSTVVSIFHHGDGQLHDRTIRELLSEPVEGLI